MRCLFGLIWIAALLNATDPPHKLLVVSVDGLDWRYLRDCDKFHLQIPNIRRLMKEGQVANGVVGVYPTITWPSHTSLITGARPAEHGILGNRRPASEGGDYYWTVDLLKRMTLWQAAAAKGMKTAAVTWPVTTPAKSGDHPITYDLPEYFQRRNGGYMDLESVSSKATPGLVEEISRAYPSFGQQWTDDRTRTQAVLFLMRNKQADLILAHLVDLDSEQHDRGPFTPESFAMLERTDELLGQILQELPKVYEMALVSDHGFEQVEHDANLRVRLKEAKVAGQVKPTGGIATTTDAGVGEFLRSEAKRPGSGVGREIPASEITKYAPELGAVVAFEPADGFMFGPANDGPYLTPPHEKGNHGFWPLRQDYRSVFILWGGEVKASQQPEMQMTDIASRLASVLGLRFP